MLNEFLRSRRAEIIAGARARVAVRGAPRPTEDELQNGVPLFLDNLIGVLESGDADSTRFEASATVHGGALRRTGFSLAQVVHDYGGICQAITELAVREHAPITTSEFQILNRSLDHAIALAVTAFQKDREQVIADDETKRLGFFAHELRNRLSSAMMAFEVIRKGNVANSGSTSAVVTRNLEALRDLITRSLAQVRLDSAHEHKHVFALCDLVEEVEVDASMEADRRGLDLTVTPVAKDVQIFADRQILGAAVSNLLQNAFKFTPVPGHVELRTTTTTDRILIEIEDECGGLPSEEAIALFRPYAQQPSRDSVGLGLGLAIAQRAVHMHGGALRVQNLPGKGCIFSIDLPRLSS